MTMLAGAAGGLVAGLVLTVAVRAWDKWSHRGERKRQIAHIRGIVERYRREIYAPDSEPKERARSYMDGLRGDLRTAIDRGSSRLEPYEIEEIDYAFLQGGPAVASNGLDFYVAKFSHAESLDWLGLPHEPPP